MKIALELTPEQLDEIAERVADKVRGSTGEILTIAQAARKAKVSRSTILRWIKAGRLPQVPGTRTIRIPAHHLEKVLLLD